MSGEGRTSAEHIAAANMLLSSAADQPVGITGVATAQAHATMALAHATLAAIKPGPAVVLAPISRAELDLDTLEAIRSTYRTMAEESHKVISAHGDPGFYACMTTLCRARLARLDELDMLIARVRG